MTARKPIGELLRGHRLDASLTIEMLAERSGISDRTISNIERGASRSPQQRTVQALAEALQLDAAHAQALYRASAGRRGQAFSPDRAVSIPPARLPDFTGREAEVGRIVEYLAHGASADSAVVVVCGPPGIGKTTAALEALRRTGAADSTPVFIDLAGLSAMPLTPLQVLQTLVQQVEEHRSDAPRSLDQAAAAWRRVSAEKRVLVLLDNAAHEEQIRPVLASSLGSAVIVTSRRSLSGLEGVLRVTLHPLSPADGQALLGRIIPASQRREGDLATLAQLCDDVPLALRIAGNRVASQPAWTTGDFIARMRHEERRLRALTAGDLGVAAAFQSSYANLRPGLHDLYRSLPLIEGATFDVRMASSIIPGDVLDTEDLLDELTDLGLLEARGSTRYRLHDLARLFATERLHQETPPALIEERTARLRHWLMVTTSRAGRWFEPQRPAPLHDGHGLDFLDADSARAWLETEADSWFPAYRDAAAHDEHDLTLLVADSLHWFSDLWSAWGHWHELFAASAEAAARVGDDLAHATHLGYLTWADIVERGDFPAAVRDATDAREAADRSGDDSQRGWSRFYLAWALDKSGDRQRSLGEAQDALAFLQSAGDREGILQAASLLAHGYHHLGSTDLAISAHQALLRQVEQTAASMPPTIVRFTRSSLERLLAEEYLAAGRPAESAALARSSLESAGDIEYATGGFTSSLILARSLASLGDTSGARNAFADAEVIAELTGIPGADAALERARRTIER